MAQRNIGANAIRTAIDRMLAVGVIDPAVVIVEARRQQDVPIVVPVSIEPTLAMFDRPAPTLGRYDELLETR